MSHWSLFVHPVRLVSEQQRTAWRTSSWAWRPSTLHPFLFPHTTWFAFGAGVGLVVGESADESVGKSVGKSVGVGEGVGRLVVALVGALMGATLGLGGESQGAALSSPDDNPSSLDHIQ